MSFVHRRLVACTGAASMLFGTASIGVAEADGSLACGTVIIVNTTLDRNIGPCAGDGIVVGADNITINLNGHDIVGTPGPGSGTQAGIRLPARTGVSIVGKKQRGRSRGAVREFDAGILINGGGSNKVENLVVRDNIGPLDSNSFLGDGIAVLHSSNNTIVGNLVAHNGRFDGIGVLGLGSDSNTIRDNTVEDNVGISEAESPPVGPGVVPFYINAPGHGIFVSHFLDQPVGTDLFISGNDVLRNSVRRNDGSGISTVANFDAVIAGNRVENNARQYYGNFNRLHEDYPPSSVIGIGVTTSDSFRRDNVQTNVVVKDNVVNNNGLIGIQIAASGNRVLRNRVFDNGALGINVDSQAFGNSIVGNRTAGNLLFDLVDQSGGQDCIDNRWRDNTYSAQVQPLGIEYGLTSSILPPCIADGPSAAGAEAQKSSVSSPDGLTGITPVQGRPRSQGL